MEFINFPEEIVLQWKDSWYEECHVDAFLGRFGANWSLSGLFVCFHCIVFLNQTKGFSSANITDGYIFPCPPGEAIPVCFPYVFLQVSAYVGNTEQVKLDASQRKA